MEFVFDISYALQVMREGTPDALVTVLFYLGEVMLAGAVFVAGGLVHWCIDKKLGQRMLLTYVLGYGVNQTVKNIACVYRPWILDQRLHVEPIAESSATGYSFPSGHTVGVSSVLAALAAGVRTRRGLVIACCAFGMALICFIRVFVGAHTLLDTLVAVAIAIVAALVVGRLMDWAEAAPGRDMIVALTGIVLTTAVAAFLITKPYPSLYVMSETPLVDPENLMVDVYKAAGMLYGFFLGWLVERRFCNFDSGGTLGRRVVRFVGGAALVGAWFVASKPALMAAGLGLIPAEAIKHFGLIFAMLAVYPFIVARVQGRNGR